MTDEERAREIAEKVRCTPGTVDIRSRVLMWSHLIAAALAAVRAEEREAAEERVRYFCDHIAHRWVMIPHNSSDGRARDTMLADCAAGRMDPAKELAAIRGRKP